MSNSPDRAAEGLSLRLDVLDLQILDADDLPIGRVDDVELDVAAPGEGPRVVALLCGQAPLGRRLGGLLGRTIERIAVRLGDPRRTGGPGLRLSPAQVAGWGAVLKLRARLAELPDAAPLERWLSDHVVRRLPGAGNAQ